MDDSRVTKSNRRQILSASAMLGIGAVVRKLPVAAAPERRERSSARHQEVREITFALTTNDQLAARSLLDEYTKRTGIEVSTAVSDYGNLYTNLNINLTQATGAFDVVSLDDPWMPRFGGDKFLVNLTEMRAKTGDSIDDDFVPQLFALGEFPAGSGQRAVPWVGNIQLFAWRTDVLDEMNAEIPTTWDEVLGLATRITTDRTANGPYGIGVRGQTGNSAASGFLPILRGFGKDLIDPKTNEPQLDTREALAAMDMYVRMAAHTPPGVDKVDHAQNGRNLCNGTIAMSADIWTDQLLKAYDPEISQVVGRIEVGLEPANKGVRRACMTGNWLLGIPESSKKKEQAFEFIRWITAATQQRKLLLNHNIPATRTSVLTDPDAVAKAPFLPDVLVAARIARPRTRTPYYRAMEEIFGRYVGEAVAGKRSGTEAMKAANAEIRKLLEREGILT